MNDKEIAPLGFQDLETALTRLGNYARQYVKEAANMEDRKKRKKEMLAMIEKMTNQIVILPDCPYGTHWDPITGTCK